MRLGANYHEKYVAALLLAAALSAGFSALAAAEDIDFMPATGAMALSGLAMPNGDFVEWIPEEEVQEISSFESAQMIDAMAAYQAPETSLLQNASEFYYYYENLEPLQRELYDVMLGVAQDPVTPENYGLMMTTVDPASETFKNAYDEALIAMTYDHPELFWLYNQSRCTISFFSDFSYVNGNYIVLFGLNEPYARYTEEVTAFNRAAEEFLAEIDRNGSEYEIAKQVHDRLIDLVTYDYDICGPGEANARDLGHSAFGALVHDGAGSEHLAVCDGYSLAYEYLLQQLGIHVVFIGGAGGANEEEAGGHAWNLVNLDGAWYETDSTWDDCLPSEAELLLLELLGDDPYIVEAATDPAYQEVLQHILFMISTDKMSNYMPEEQEMYTTKDGQEVFCLKEPSVHIRLNDLPAYRIFYDPRCEVIKYAPTAEHNYRSAK